MVLGKERFRKKKVLSWNLFFFGVLSLFDADGID